MTKKSPNSPPPFTLQEHLLTGGVAIIVGIGVMIALEHFIIGFLAFLITFIGMNIYILKRKGYKF